MGLDFGIGYQVYTPYLDVGYTSDYSKMFKVSFNSLFFSAVTTLTALNVANMHTRREPPRTSQIVSQIAVAVFIDNSNKHFEGNYNI